jgi:hypothetical protein
MIILDATTKSLQIVLGAIKTTTDMPFVLGYVDLLSSDQSISAVGSNDGTSNGTSVVAVLAAPAAGHTRQVKFISIQNADTITQTLTLQYNDNSTLRTIVQVALAVGDNLIYTD